MANIFTLENNAEEFAEKISIDELYEKKRINDLNQLALFQKILNRIHVRIKLTSRQNVEDRFCWFVIPEVIIGVAKYNQSNCIAYIMDKLQENGFAVRYFHPNTILISWNHWIPSYVRSEVKKKTGIVINEYGMKQQSTEDEHDNNDLSALFNSNSGAGISSSKSNSSSSNSRNNMTSGTKNGSLSQSGNNNAAVGKANNNKRFTPINSYKPTGNLVYNEDLINRIENKIN